MPSRRSLSQILLVAGLTVLGLLVIGLTVGLIVRISKDPEYTRGATRI